MSSLVELQQGFMGYLLGEKTDIEQHIQSTPTLSAKHRLNIYAYAYRARLKEAITTDYEQLHSYLGDEQFYELLERYIDKHPSEVTNLRYYSISMSDFLSTETPYSEMPILAEIAEIEAALANSFDAPNQTPITIDELATLSETAWGDLRFETHPSLQIRSFNHNSFSVWKALSDDQTPPTSEQYSTPETWLLWRNTSLITQYRPILSAEATALSFARQGQTFPAICEALLDFYTEDEVPVKAITFLQTWIQEDLITALISEQV